MRKAVTEGTASALYIPGVKIAAKTGTAELGVSKSRVNSWTIGYFPSDAPRYAFAIVMERGVRGNTRNAAYVGSRVIRSLQRETPDYLKGSTSPGLPLPPEPAEEVVVDVMASSTGSSETVSSTTPSIIPTFPAGASSTPGGATSTVDPPGVFPEIPLPEEVTE
jgi:membrane peptidoglycan carboxypeptidase